MGHVHTTGVSHIHSTHTMQRSSDVLQAIHNPLPSETEATARAVHNSATSFYGPASPMVASTPTRGTAQRSPDYGYIESIEGYSGHRPQRLVQPRTDHLGSGGDDLIFSPPRSPTRRPSDASIPMGTPDRRGALFNPWYNSMR